MVIRGGENLYPREIEEFIPPSEDPGRPQVVGVPDEKYGEELCAWIVLKKDETLSEEGVRAFCKDRIARHRVPRYIRFVEGFPTTVTRQGLQFVTRDTMIEELGLKTAKTA